MWSYLVVLVLAPLLATAGLGAVVVDVRLDEVHHLQTAEQLLRASVRVDAVRRAVDQELLPTLILDVVRDDARARAAGLTGGLRDQLRTDNETALRAARLRTDAALADAGAVGVVATATRQLAAVRADADAEAVGPALLTSRYLDVSDALGIAERAAAVRAGAAGVDARTAEAVGDVGFVVDLTGLASRQLPLLFAALVVTGTERADLQTAWRAAAGGFDRLSSTSGSLSDPELRQGVHAATTYGVSAQLVTRLASPGALTPGAPGALVASQVLDLAPPSGARDAALADLLDHAVDTAVASSTADRTRAQRQLRATVVLVVLVLVVSAGVTAAVGDVLGRALRQLAVAADRARDGLPFEAPASGPREVRRVAGTLAHTADGMLRVREQVEAVARGDLATALASPPVPGRLGEGVHASVQAVVRAVAAGDALRAQLAERASTDALTGLPNRSTTLEAVDAARGGALAAGTTAAVLFLDLDGFKQVNDTLGHAAGDEVLQVSARRMLAAVRADDVVGRLGGDEFVVVAADVDEGVAADLAHRLVAALSEPVELAGGRTAELGASAGVALTRGDLDADGLLAEADAAVYRAKAAGRGRVELAGSAAGAAAVPLAHPAPAAGGS